MNAQKTCRNIAKKSTKSIGWGLAKALLAEEKQKNCSRVNIDSIRKQESEPSIFMKTSPKSNGEFKIIDRV